MITLLYHNKSPSAIGTSSRCSKLTGIVSVNRRQLAYVHTANNESGQWPANEASGSMCAHGEQMNDNRLLGVF